MAEETAVAVAAENQPEPANVESGPRERRPRGGARRRGPKKDGPQTADKKDTNSEKPADTNEATEKPKKPRNRPAPKCKYFKATGVCKFGSECKFRHVYTPKEESDAVPVETASAPSEPTQAPVIHMPLRQVRKIEPVRPQRQILTAEQIGSDEQQKARTAEINYFKRRFPGTTVTDIADGKTKIAFSYNVTDPEWPFDVRIVDFTLTIAAEHPISKATLDAEEGLMPSALHVFLVQQFNKIITEKHEADVAANAFEVIGKWLIRRIDINIFDVFVAGLKRAQLIQNAATCGIRVTVPKKVESQKEERPLTTAEEVAAALASVNGNGSNDENENLSESEDDGAPGSSGSSNNPSKPKGASKSATSKSDVPSSAKLNLVANWTNEDQSIGTLTLVYLSGATRCLRCGQQDFFEVAEGKTKQWPCKKCATAQSIRFESALAHAASNTIAHIYPVGCRPTDCVLQGSKLKAVCFNCTHELLVEALPYAAPSKTWCRECNAKLCFTILSTSFQGNVAAIPMGDKPKLPKLKKPKENGFAIVVGQPLPNKGTCKHYSKSYRWFRFPCCGKLYPCDTCHDQTEDHDCDFANRMICGLCSTEQGYSKDKCKFCDNNVTKVSTAHWEGGKGCRNQKAMSKNDPRKYKNSAAKTVPTKRTGKKTKSESSK